MIDPTRRHGHYDTRWQLPGRRAGTPTGPTGDDGLPWIQIWENEGGRSASVSGRVRRGSLEWSAFAQCYFPGRRRHDFGALKAYEAYLVA